MSLGRGIKNRIPRGNWTSAVLCRTWNPFWRGDPKKT